MDGFSPPAQSRQNSDEAAPDRPVNRPMVFAVVAISLLMISIDSTIVATALHALQDGLDTSVNWAGWTLTAYALGFVIMLPVAGRLSERFGCRRVFLASVLVFTLASLFCGMANNIYLLIALRALQAVGGAGFSPSVTGLIVNLFGDARDRAVSLFGSILPIGAMIGPIFGGLFVTYGSWRGIFYVNVPVGIIVILLSLRFIPPDRVPPAPSDRRGWRGFDLAGALLLTLCLLAAMLAVSYLGERDTRPLVPLLWALLAVSVGCGWMFYRHINRAPSPLLLPRLIYGRGFGAVNLANIVYGGVTIGGVALLPLYAASRYGIGALEAGTLLIAQGIAMTLTSTLAALAIRRTGYRLPLYSGSVIIALGTFLLAFHPPAGLSAYAWLAIAAFVCGVGAGVINPAGRNAGLQLAPDHASTLAALRSMFFHLGSISTISVATAVLNHSTSPGQAQAWVYVVLALLLLAAIPIIHRITEHRGAW